MSEQEPTQKRNRFAMEMYDHIKSIPLPRGFDEEGERLSHDKDEHLDRFLNMLPLLEEAITDGPSEVASEISISLMNKPFAYLDLTKNSPPKLRELAQLFYKLAIPAIHGHRQNEADDITLSTATLYYLYKCEHATGMVPMFAQVMSHTSQLTHSFPYVASLLRITRALGHEKGLLLLDSLVARVDSIDRDVFQTMIETSKINEYLYQIMVLSDSRSCRRQAYELFERLCNLVPLDCRLKTFTTALASVDVRSNVKAACVDLYRKSLSEFDKKQCDKQDDTCCQEEYKRIGGRNLVMFLKQSVDICLPNSKPDDILDNCDMIAATLALLKYLKLRKLNQLYQSQQVGEEEDKYLNSVQLKKDFLETLANLLSTAMGDVQKLLSCEANADELKVLEWTMTRFELIKFTLVNTASLYNC